MKRPFSRDEALQIAPEVVRAALLDAAELRLVAPSAVDLMISFVRQHERFVELYDWMYAGHVTWRRVHDAHLAEAQRKADAADAWEKRVRELEDARSADDLRIVKLLAEIAELRRQLPAKPKRGRRAKCETPTAIPPPPPMRASSATPSGLVFRLTRGQA